MSHVTGPNAHSYYNTYEPTFTKSDWGRFVGPLKRAWEEKVGASRGDLTRDQTPIFKDDIHNKIWKLYQELDTMTHIPSYQKFGMNYMIEDVTIVGTK